MTLFKCTAKSFKWPLSPSHLDPVWSELQEGDLFLFQEPSRLPIRVENGDLEEAYAQDPTSMDL